MSDSGLMVVGVTLGTALGAILMMVILGIWATTPLDVYTEVCTDVFAAEYVADLSACLDGDTIVHRFGVTS